jgi:hypothetical protein
MYVPLTLRSPWEASTGVAKYYARRRVTPILSSFHTGGATGNLL